MSNKRTSRAFQPTSPVWLLGAALVTVLLWQVPGGNFLLYPFTILATWFHEMAHGLAALLLGGSFTKLLIFSDGSGMAYYTGPLFLDPVGQALVAAAGPLGPPIAGAALILASRNVKAARVCLALLGAFLILSTVIWVRTAVGFVVIAALGLATLAIALKAGFRVQVFAVQFLGVQACISTYQTVGYLFTYSTPHMGISDTGRMQQILILPYWLWGALIVGISCVLLVASLRRAYR